MSTQSKYTHLKIISLFVFCSVLFSCCYIPRPNVTSQDSYERYLGVLEIPKNPTAENMTKLIELWSDKNELVREGALKSMAKLGNAPFKEYALKSLDDESWLVKSQAVVTLKTLDNIIAQAELPKRLTKEKDPKVKIQIVRSLENTPEGIASLVELIEDNDKGVVYNAHKRLVQLTGQNLPCQKTAWQDWLKRKP